MAGLTHEDFWRLTPREVDMSITAYSERERRADLRAGVLAATVINMTPRKSKRVVKPYDVFPTLRPQRGPQKAEQQRVLLHGMAVLMGGKVQRVSRAAYEAMKLGAARA